MKTHWVSAINILLVGSIPAIFLGLAAENRHDIVLWIVTLFVALLVIILAVLTAREEYLYDE